jgi:hypothetical protein
MTQAFWRVCDIVQYRRYKCKNKEKNLKKKEKVQVWKENVDNKLWRPISSSISSYFMLKFIINYFFFKGINVTIFQNSWKIKERKNEL